MSCHLLREKLADGQAAIEMVGSVAQDKLEYAVQVESQKLEAGRSAGSVQAEERKQSYISAM